MFVLYKRDLVCVYVGGLCFLIPLFYVNRQLSSLKEISYRYDVRKIANSWILKNRSCLQPESESETWPFITNENNNQDTLFLLQ